MTFAILAILLAVLFGLLIFTRESGKYQCPGCGDVRLNDLVLTDSGALMCKKCLRLFEMDEIV